MAPSIISFRRFAVVAVIGLVVLAGHPVPATASPAALTRVQVAASCTVGQSGAAVPTPSSGRAAVRATIGVAKTMGVPVKGQIVAVMVMYQESSIRNLANDGTSTQAASFPTPGRAYWLNVTRLSLKYPHDRFGSLDGAHDTDSIGLYQQRPSWGWGDYGASTGVTDPEGVVQRLLDPRWEAMAFFGGARSAAPTWGLLDVSGWQSMSPTDAAEAVQGSTRGDLYAKWEPAATQLVNDNQDAPAIGLPWTPGGGAGALACTSIPTDPRLGEAGRNPIGTLDGAGIDGTSIRVSGWMIDPDAVNGLGQIHFYDSGPYGVTGYPTGLADQPRDDVNRVYNVFGSFGYTALLPWTGPGRHTICAYGINVGRGTGNPALGCRTVDVPGPIGSVDAVRVNAAGTIDVVGWAADPAAPGVREEVHVYVTGPTGTRGTPGILTGESRLDVAAKYAWSGPNQGFRTTVAAAGEGENTVCVYAINVRPPQSNPLLGCRTIDVRTYPIGNLDTVTGNGTQAYVAGWALDPLAPASSRPVHVYVFGPAGQVSGTPFTATGPRADVNAALRLPGDHGFSEFVTVFPGSNSVCVFAIGTLTDHNTMLGCRTVTGPAAAGAATQGRLAAGDGPAAEAEPPAPTATLTPTPPSEPAVVVNTTPTPAGSEPPASTPTVPVEPAGTSPAHPSGDAG